MPVRSNERQFATPALEPIASEACNASLPTIGHARLLSQIAELKSDPCGWDIIRKAAQSAPAYALDHAQELLSDPRGKRILFSAAKAVVGIDSSSALRAVPALRTFPDGEKVASKLVDRIAAKFPNTLVRFPDLLLERNDAPDVLHRAAQGAYSDVVAYAPNYLDFPETAELVAEIGRRSPRHVIDNARQVMELPNAEKILTAAAKEEPLDFQRNFVSVLGTPWGRALIENAFGPDGWRSYEGDVVQFTPAMSDTEIALQVTRYEPQMIATNISRLARLPGGERIVKTLVTIAPDTAAEVAFDGQNLRDLPNGDKILRQMADRAPQSLLYGATLGRPDTVPGELITGAAELRPDAFLRSGIERSKINNFEELVRQSALRAPAAAAQAVEDNFDVGNVLRTSNDPAIQTLYKIVEPIERLGDETREKSLQDLMAVTDPDKVERYARAATLLDSVVGGRLTVEAAWDLAKAADSSYYRELLAIEARPGHLGDASVHAAFEDTALRTLRNINDLHEQPDSIRFKSLEGLTAREMLRLAVEGDEEMFTSTFNGLFDRMKEQMKVEQIDGGAIVSDLSTNHARTLLRLLVTYDREKEFFELVPADKRYDLLDLMAKGIEDEKGSIGQAITISEILANTQDKEILGRVENILRSEYERNLQEGDREGQTLYGLIGSAHSSDAVREKEWTEQMNKQYQIGKSHELPLSSLVAPDGVHYQRFLFSDDRDGRNSYGHFLGSYTDNKRWKVEGRGDTVHITSRNQPVKVEIVANKPGAGEAGQKAVDAFFAENKVAPHIIVHRGHSYHVSDTIPRIKPGTAMVMLGSCGGYNVLEHVLNRAPNAQVIATKGVGRMALNDPIMREITDTIASGKNISWDPLWKKLESKLGDTSGFDSYVAPNLNVGVRMLRAHHQILGRDSYAESYDEREPTWD